MKIAVYSGSFDPLHIGHKAIMEYLTVKQEYDMVYLIVSPQNPLKEAGKAQSARERFEAALEAVARHPELKVKVDDIELGLPAPTYTITTLDCLKQREPHNDFTLVIGADNLARMRKWKDYETILSQYGVAVYPRKDFEVEKLKAELMAQSPSDKPYKIDIINAPMVDISSTQIREATARGEDMTEYLM